MPVSPRVWHTLAQLRTATLALGVGCTSVTPDPDPVTRSEVAADGGRLDGALSDGEVPREGGPPLCGALGKCSLDSGPPPGTCDHYALSPDGLGFKCAPPPCGEGTPECMQLCEDLCAVGPACGYAEDDCLRTCRDRLRCPGETPGMDVAICMGARAEAVTGPEAQCGLLEYWLDDAPADDPVCVLLAHGARFESPSSSALCVDASAECVQSLTFVDGSFVWSLGAATDAGSFVCSGSEVQLAGTFPSVWAYDAHGFRLMRTDAEEVLTLEDPSFGTSGTDLDAAP